MCVGPEKLKKGSPTEDDDTVRAERAKVMAAAPGFYWDTYTDEPHASRRAAIVKAHPEIKKLFGHCPLTKWKGESRFLDRKPDAPCRPGPSPTLSN